MPSDCRESALLLNYLHALEEETIFLLENGAHDSPRSVPMADLQSRLKALKEKIKSDAKSVGKALKDDDFSSVGNAFIEPALRQASANFTMRSDTKPFTPQWVRGLYSLQIELSYHRSMLEKYIKNSTD